MTKEARQIPKIVHPVVVVGGKFQPLHNEHLNYILCAFNIAEHVVIGITNPDPILIREEAADPIRSQPDSNPFTYFERLKMIKASLEERAVDSERYDIVPFPINLPELWRFYIPMWAPFLITLYEDDPWLKERRRKLESNGLRVEVLWSKPGKGITGKEVRSLIKRREPWEQLVPVGAAKVIRESSFYKEN